MLLNVASSFQALLDGRAAGAGLQPGIAEHHRGTVLAGAAAGRAGGPGGGWTVPELARFPAAGGEVAGDGM
jgi:hypothetical protein